MKKQNKIIFFYCIDNFLKKVKRKNCFVGVLSFSVKACLAILTKPAPISFQLSPSDQTNINIAHSFHTDVQITRLNTTQFFSDEKTLKTFFTYIQPKQVEEKLYRSFYFCLSVRGSHLADPTRDNVEHLKNELFLLISALYNCHRFTRKENYNGA